MAYQYPLNGGRINASVGGNSTSAGAGYQLVSTGTLLLAGGNNITLSQNGSAITISGANAPSGSINFSASNASANLASVTLSNSNGVSFGLNAGVITASHNGITNQSAQTIGGYATGNTTGQSSSSTFDARSMSMSGVGGVSLGYSGSMLQVSGPAVSSLSQTGIVSISRNGSTISIGAPAFSAGISSNSTVTNQIIFGAGNNVTLSQSTNATGATLSIGAANQTVQTQSNIQGVIASGSTNRTGDISFANSNGVTFGLSNNTITASVAGASAGIAALANSQTTYTSGTVRLVEGSGAITINSSVNGASQSYKFNVPATSSISATGAFSISTNGSTVSMGVPAQTNQTLGLYATGNTTQSSSTTLDARSLTFNGLNGISVGFSNGSIQLSGATGGAGGGVALYDGANSISSGTARLSAGGALTASVNGQTLSLNAPAVSSLTAAGAISLSSNGSTITVSAPQNGTVSNWEPLPFNMIESTASTVLGSNGASQMFYKLQPEAYVSASQFLQMISASLSTSSNSSYAGTITVGAGIYTANGSTLSLITQSSGSASYTWSNTSNNLSASLTGLRALTLPMNINMSPGNYWLGMWSRTSSTRANWATIANVVISNGTNPYNGLFFAAAAGATQGLQAGVGHYNATTSALMASAAMSSITQTNVSSNQMQYVAFKNQTW